MTVVVWPVPQSLVWSTAVEEVGEVRVGLGVTWAIQALDRGWHGEELGWGGKQELRDKG